MKNSPKAVMRLVPSKVNLLPLRLQGMFDLLLVSFSLFRILRIRSGLVSSQALLNILISMGANFSKECLPIQRLDKESNSVGGGRKAL